MNLVDIVKSLEHGTGAELLAFNSSEERSFMEVVIAEEETGHHPKIPAASMDICSCLQRYYIKLKVKPIKGFVIVNKLRK
jgi:hypothetical protein